MTVASLDYSPAARLTCQDLGGEVLGDGEWASSRGGGVRRTDPGLRAYLQCRYAGMGTEGSVSLEVRPKSGSRFGVHSNRRAPGLAEPLARATEVHAAAVTGAQKGASHCYCGGS